MMDQQSLPLESPDTDTQEQPALQAKPDTTSMPFVNSAPLYPPGEDVQKTGLDIGHVGLPSVLWGELKEGVTFGFDLTANVLMRQVGYRDLMSLTGGKFLTPSQYESSQYKIPGVTHSESIPIDLAREEKDHFDRTQRFKDVKARTDQGFFPSMVEGSAFIGGVIINPLSDLVAGIVGLTGIESLAASSLTKLLPAIKTLEPGTQALISGLASTSVRGGVELPAFTALSYASAKAHYEKADPWQIAESVPLGMGIGAAGVLAGRFLIKPIADALFPEAISAQMPIVTHDQLMKDKLKGMPKVSKEAADTIMQPISQDAHETTLTTAIEQLENGKIPDTGEITRQALVNQWHEDLGNLSSKDYEDLQNKLSSNKDILDRQKEANDQQIDELRSKGFADDSKEVQKELNTRTNIKNAADNYDSILDRMNNPPVPPTPGEVDNYIDKMNNQISDFPSSKSLGHTHIEPEVPTEDAYNNKLDKFLSDNAQEMKDMDFSDIENEHTIKSRMLKDIFDCMGA